MSKVIQYALGMLAAAALASISVPALAQAPYSEATPTKKGPLQFTAFAVQMQTSMSGVVDITI